jgi:hypothetical protein
MLRSMALAFSLAAMGAVAQGIVAVPNDDLEMGQAQAKVGHTARPRVEKPGPGEEGFALKVALPYGACRRKGPCATGPCWRSQVHAEYHRPLVLC